MSASLFNLISRLGYLWNDFHSFIIFYIFFFGIFLFIFLKLVKYRPGIWRTLGLNLIIFLFLAVNLFYGLEIYFRYFFDRTDNIFQIKTTQRWKDRHVIINAFSFRDDHFFIDKDPRELRIAVLGDSYTWGYGIKDRVNRWGDRLQQQLTKDCETKGKTVKVYNLAMPGMSTRDHTQLINDYVKKYKIDAIIIGYYMDDGNSDMTPRHIEPCYNRFFSYRYIPIVRDLINSSYALEFFYVRFYNRFIFPSFGDQCWTLSYEKQYSDPELWVRHLQRLQGIIDYTRDNNVGLAFMMIPYLKFLSPNYPATDIHKRLVTFFEENEVPVVDLLSIFSEYKPVDLMVNQNDYHANELGHQLASQAIYNKIKDNDKFTCH